MVGIDSLLSYILSFFTSWPSQAAPITATKVLFGLVILAIIYFGLNLASFLILHMAQRVAKRTKTTLDDEILIALQNPIQYSIVLVSLFAFSLYLLPDQTIYHVSIHILFRILLIVLATYTLDKLTKTAVTWYYTDPLAKTNAGIREEVIPIISKSISVVIYLSGLVVVLHQLGVEVSPLLAGLGIAGLAVALALQDSLTNFFAGMYLLADRPVKIGDFIRVEDGTAAGTEGYVQEIGWRSIRLRQMSNNSVIIPNNKLAASIITNYSLPSMESVASLTVGVAYDSDPDEVEEAIEAAVKNAAKKLPLGTIVDKKPSIRFWDFGDSALTFKAFVPVVNHTSQWEAMSAVRKELLREFKKRKIEIPFPIRTIYTKKGG